MGPAEADPTIRAPLRTPFTSSSLEAKLLVDGRLDVVDGLLDGTEVFLFRVRNFDAEGVFEGEGHFNRREAVGAEVFDEGGLVLDVLFLDAELFSNNLLNLQFDIFQFFNSALMG